MDVSVSVSPTLPSPIEDNNVRTLPTKCEDYRPPLELEKSRTKRPRHPEFYSADSAECEEAEESPTKKRVEVGTCESNREDNEDISVDREERFELEIEQDLLLPPPPCPTPSIPLPSEPDVNQLQKQISELLIIKSRLERERQLDLEKHQIQVLLLEEELAASRLSCTLDFAAPASQAPSNAIFKQYTDGQRKPRAARIALLTQQVKSNNAYILQLMRSPSFAVPLKVPDRTNATGTTTVGGR